MLPIRLLFARHMDNCKLNIFICLFALFWMPPKTVCQLRSPYDSGVPSSVGLPNAFVNSVENQNGAELLIETSAGTVQGDYKFTNNVQTTTIRQFIGIPYAQKPIGYYRFSKPAPFVRDVRFGSTSSVINTRQEVRCVQTRNIRNINYLKLFENIPESEDCLYLNVYAPSRFLQNGQKYPVVVYLHGGEFKVGSKFVLNPGLLVNKQIVLVTVNYRLGVFGFLSYDNEFLPGNIGIQDVILALKWVQREIIGFSGDSTKITLFGHDSGAIIANLLMAANLEDTSQLSLFQRVILSGGTVFSPFALDYFPTYQTELLSMQLGCSDQRFNYRDLVQCFREVSADRLIQSVEQIKSEISSKDSFLSRIQLDFRPVMDFNRTYPLFLGDPITLFETGQYAQKMPLIVLLTQHEGTHYFYQIEQQLESALKSPVNFTDVIIHMIRPYVRPDSNYAALAAAIQNEYLGPYLDKFSGPLENKRLLNFEVFSLLSLAVGDFLQYAPAHNLLRIHSLTSRTAQLYIFSQNQAIADGRCLLWPEIRHFRLCPTHDDALMYMLFNEDPNQFTQASQLLNLLGNFASGNVAHLSENYFAINRPTQLKYNQINTRNSFSIISGINFRPINTLRFWTEYIQQLGDYTRIQHVYFPLRQFQDFRQATYSLVGLCIVFLLLSIGLLAYILKRRQKDRRTLKLLRERVPELKQRYRDEDNEEQTEAL